MEGLELTILMPCLNEAKTLPGCIAEAKAFLAGSGTAGEVLIADNGSTDGSAALARSLGARVEHVPARGYGSALRAGLAAANGRYVIMGDCDGSYDFLHLEEFLRLLRAGNPLVMGDRFRGGIQKGAMPPSHRYFGVPALSALGRLAYRTAVRDFHCGLRGVERETALALGLGSTGMEFATEMIGAFALNRLPIAQTPTPLRPDGRGAPSHLRSVRDGLRHLHLMLRFNALTYKKSKKRGK